MIVLPELSFTGASFYSKEDIMPYTYEAGKGYIFEWCVKWALKLKCLVFVGYPERAGEDVYNSMLVVSEEGVLLRNYRKH
jgi:predicted amidohydrolase